MYGADSRHESRGAQARVEELKNLLNQLCQEMYGAESRRESRGAQAREELENLLNQACQEMYGAESRDKNCREFLGAQAHEDNPGALEGRFLLVASPPTCWTGQSFLVATSQLCVCSGVMQLASGKKLDACSCVMCLHRFFVDL